MQLDRPSPTPPDPPIPISLSQPETRTSPPLPPLTQAGRPVRNYQVPNRYPQELLPEPPCPAVQLDNAGAPSLRILPRINLIVRDTFRTVLNSFGIWREYWHRPSYDPDAFVSVDDLARPHSSSHSVESPDLLPDRGYRNKSISLLINWQNDGDTTKSDSSINKLVKEVLLHPDFHLSDLKGFSARRENDIADKADTKSTLLTSFSEASVDIEVPSGDKNVPSAKFSVTGLHYRSLLSILRSAFADPLATMFHLSPYKMFHKSPTSGAEQRIYSEMYDSDVFIEEHDRVQRAALPPDDPDCKRERVVAAMMFWSDSTHLANFGTAKLWPIYMMLGNLSKYIRALPSSGACMHVAYIPHLADSFEDFASTFHCKWGTQKGDILTHCRRELMHAIWSFLLDEDFLHAYTYGIVIQCIDGIERRVYPRIFTYSADYPEKYVQSSCRWMVLTQCSFRVLLATIRNKGLCPCPRCLIPKTKIDLLGQVRDHAQRINEARSILYDGVQTARRFIYQLANPINGTAVDQLLKPTSSVPTVVSHVDVFQLQRAFTYPLDCRMLSHNVLVRASMSAECL
jgi:hypothetical protein